VDVSAADLRDHSLSQSLRGLEAEEVYAFLGEKERERDETRSRPEVKQTELRSIARRLQETLRVETEALSSVAPDSKAAPDDAPDSSSPRSSDEWVDSLFPNRLPETNPASPDTAHSPNDNEASSADDEEADRSASESQF
jgi:DivIVA domain-containing protein